MFDFERRLSELSRQSVLCVGDVMLDRYVYGDVARVSPEAPTVVLAARREDISPGGAANVALNVAGLGARCVLVGVVGDDEAARALSEPLRKAGKVNPRLVKDGSRPTTMKVRYVSEHYSTHLLRADWEDVRPLEIERENEILEHALEALEKCGAVVLSDYGKGVLTQRVIEELIAAATKAKKPVVVDPKGNDYRIYRFATLVTPNRGELSRALNREVRTAEEIASGAGELCARTDIGAILVTRSEEGMTLVERGDEEPVHIPAYPVKIRDVSGAGDTVTATAATMLAMGADLEAAARAANAAAAVVVGKRGTATVSLVELRTMLVPPALRAYEEKLALDPKAMDERLNEWRRAGLRIGFTNGCFDLLHPGHLKVLAEARAACDRLVVGLNSDASTRRLKGESRPIQDEVSRAQLLAALEAVDMVAIFEEDTPIELIRRVRPQVLVKGGDYTKDQVVGREIVEAAGGEILLVDLLPERSTTRIVERSIKLV
jgi:D-beta-D-heptose 7-phosphate kinase/D-beta-D-heptose 1-phosphate adenosyltransferase